MTLTWSADSTLSAYKLDPYSEWLADKGRDFDFSMDEVVEAPEDFTYYGAVQTFDTASLPGSFAGHELYRLHTKVGATDLYTPVRISDSITSLTGTGPGSLDEFIGTGPLEETIAFRTPLRESATPRTPRNVFDGTNPLAYDTPTGSDAEKLVVIGILDDAINIAHERFRMTGGKTRVDYAWIQDGVARTPSSGSDPTDRYVGFGREIVRSEIESAIAASGGDDGALLAALGLIDFARAGYNSIARPVSHGTHVLDLATGADLASADVDQRIVSVQIPTIATADTSGALLRYFVLCGICYILERARVISVKIGEAVPVVVNLSYGFSGGPHDGSDFVQRAMRGAAEDHKRKMAALGFTDDVIVEVVVPAGNRLLGRGQAESPPSSAASETVSLTLPWRVQPGDRTPSYLELWVPSSLTSGELRIGLPGASPTAVPLLPSLTPQVLAPSGSPGDVLLRVTVDGYDAASNFGQTRPDPTRNKIRVLIAMAPTDTSIGTRMPASSGIWTVEMDILSTDADQRIEAWIQRDDSPYGLRNKGRQSYFDDPLYVRFDDMGAYEVDDPPRGTPGSSVVRRQGTLNGIAAGERVIVAAAYIYSSVSCSGGTATVVGSGNPLPRYSASAKGDGGTDYTSQRRPDAAAPADASHALPGLLAAGTFSGSKAVLSGTSVAAPQVVRLIADHLTTPANRPGFNGSLFVRGSACGGSGLPPLRAGQGPLAIDSALVAAAERGRIM